MCGIAGIVDYRRRSDGRQATEKMLSAISYRGPDESGIYHSPFASIGNVRLSIIDVAGGQQPLCDPSSRYWITFNGEIFNYRELRKELESKGNIFRTNSDTEVLVQLYALYGSKCLQKLNGQFAFAIWDRQEEELFFARDRVGIRPFFYTFQDGVFSFASEIKALFTQNSISRELNYEGLIQTFTFWTTITPDTVFRNISELSPGHFGLFSRKGFRTMPFWNICFDCERQSISLSEAIERFHELFSDAVRIRLRADVEVAAYLSGGIDSSATVGYIKEIEPGILNTFSIGFSEKHFDESHYQNEAVRYFNTRHSKYECSAKEIAAIFPKVIWHSEMPLTRTAPAPMLLLSKLVRENNIKVVVTGEGSDEMLGGYDIFKETLIRRFWANQPDSRFRPMLLKKLYQYIPQIAGANLATIRMFFRYKLEETADPFYSHILRWNNSNHIKRHLSGNIKDQTISYSPLSSLALRLPENFDSWDALAKSQWIETTVFMSGYLLSSQGDRMSMANSVEGRYPFLDYRVIEFCNSLPSSFKIKGLTEKYLLKKLLKNRIPEGIVNRTKQPYRAPVSNVFLGKDAPDYAEEMLSEEFTLKAGIFDYKSINAAVSRIRKAESSSETDDMLITAVISAHLLHQQFIENRNEAFSPAGLNNLKVIEDLQLIEVPN
jgi:asparagine synthase (glutamine-hydrolysing)